MQARQGRAETGNGFLGEEHNEPLVWYQGDVGLNAGRDKAICEAAVGEFHTA